VNSNPRITAWLTGTLAINTATVPAHLQPMIETLRSQLTLTKRGHAMSFTETPFWSQRENWLYIPRSYPLTPEGAWLRPYLDIQEGRSLGRALPRWTRLEGIRFGVPPFPPGQPQFIQDIINHSQRTTVGGIATAPTRSGKTLCAIAAAIGLGRATLILVDNVEIMRQWQKTIEDNVRCNNGQRVACGVIRAERFEHTAFFAVATIQTLARRRLSDDCRRAFGTIIVDECQGAPCDMIWGALMRLDSQYVIGMTATPRRGDGLGAAIPWLNGPPIATLERQLSADVMFLHYPYRKAKILKIDPDTGAEKWVTPRLTNFGRLNRNNAAKAMFADDAFAPWLAAHMKAGIEQGRKVLTLVLLRDNVDQLNRACRDIGLSPGLFYGSMTAEASTMAMRQNPCIATLSKASKGVDFQPPPTMLMLACPLSDAEQATGRGLQPQAPCKPILVDVVVGAKPLIKQANRRFAYYRSKRFDIRNNPWPEVVFA